MRVCAMFGRPDVEGFKGEVDADQWAKWQQFEAVEPSGWRGLQSVAGHVAYHVRQAAAPKAKLDYSKFAPRFVIARPKTVQQDRAFWEAFAAGTQAARK